MLGRVLCRDHQVKVGCILIVHEWLYFLGPGLEFFALFHVVEVVENGGLLREVGRLELVAHYRVKPVLELLLEGATKTPGKTPGEETINHLFLVLISSQEALLRFDEALKEIANRDYLLQVRGLDGLRAMGPDEFETDIDSRIEKHVQMILEELTEKVFVIEVRFHPRLDIWPPAKLLWRQVDHTTSRNSRWRCHGQVLNLKQHSHLSSQLNPLAIGQAEGHVVVQDSVHVLNPKCIDWSIEHSPAPFLTGFLGSFSHLHRGETIEPLLRDLVDLAVHFTHGNSFRVEHDSPD